VCNEYCTLGRLCRYRLGIDGILRYRRRAAFTFVRAAVRRWSSAATAIAARFTAMAIARARPVRMVSGKPEVATSAAAMDASRMPSECAAIALV
jgi:hypothetical protein